MCYTKTADQPNPWYTECRDFIKNIGTNTTYADETALIDAGGNYGCWRSSTGLTGIDEGKSYSCANNYQHYAKIRTCSQCDSMGVCIKLP